MAPAPIWMDRLFVVGHVAKGVVFVMIGGLGTYAVFHGSRDPQGMLDVLLWLHEQAFGKALVTILGLGLLGHAVWRWVQAFDGDANRNSKLVGMGERVAHAIGGTFYGLLSVFAFSLLGPHSDTGSDDGKQEEVLESTLKIPWGEWVVGLVGATIILVGIILAVRGLKKHMMLELNKDKMANWEITMYRVIGMGGHLAWGLVNSIIGYFLIRVALTSEPEKFRGIKGTLEFVGGNTFGTTLLGVVSVGILLFGLFMFTKARYQRTG